VHGGAGVVRGRGRVGGCGEESGEVRGRSPPPARGWRRGGGRGFFCDARLEGERPVHVVVREHESRPGPGTRDGAFDAGATAG